MTQLPPGSEGTAAGVLAWGFICLFSNLLIIWLLVQSKEKGSCKRSTFWQSPERGSADSVSNCEYLLNKLQISSS